MVDKNKTVKSIALYRFVAMILVVTGHLITVATYSYEIVDVINGPLESPILPTNFLASFDGSLATTFHTNFGSLAVVMFFIASGYLISMMMDRYSRLEFGVNRVFSIFPTLWASVILVALVVYVSQGIVYSWADLLGSMFPFIPRTSGTFVTLVLWTLQIEIKFYLLAFIFWKNRKDLVVYGYIITIFVALFYYEYRSPWVHTQMYDLLFMCFSYIGVIIEMGTREKVKREGNMYCTIAACILLNLILFKTSTYIFSEDYAFYSSCTTHVIPVLILSMFMWIERKYPKALIHIPKFVYGASKLSMPVYCTHVGCGLTVMYWLSRKGCGLGVTVLGGYITAFLIAMIIYYLCTQPSISWMKKIIKAMRKEK